MTDVKQALEQKAASKKEQPVKLTKSITIADMVKALEPEIRRALPAVLTPERFIRMALSAINNTPELANCTPMSFIAVIAALINAAQLGIEPNTPLGQAYLIPYKNKGILECQFQLGYKGLIDLACRTGLQEYFKKGCGLSFCFLIPGKVVLFWYLLDNLPSPCYSIPR